MGRNAKHNLFMLILLCVFISCIIPYNAQAKASFPTFEKKMSVFYYPNEVDEYNAQYLHLPQKSSFSDLKSSNSSVAELIGKKDEYENVWLIIQPKKAGTTKLSFRVQIGKKSKAYNIKLTVNKYQNPVKTFKLGNKNYAAKFKNRMNNVSEKKISGKVNIKAAKNWKIVSIQKYTLEDEYQNLKNGKKYTFKPFSQLIVTCRNKKTKVVEEIYLQVGYP